MSVKCCDPSLEQTSIRTKLLNGILYIWVNDVLATTDLSSLSSGIKFGQSIIFNPISSKTEQVGTFTLDAFSTSDLPITYYTSNSSIASIVGNVVTIHTFGTVYITATQVGNDEYNPATPITHPLYIVPEGAVFNVLYGWKDTNTIPTELEITTYLKLEDVISGEDYEVEFPTLNEPKYYVILEPITQPIKTKWYANSLRFGNIGSFPETIRLSPTGVGPYRVYITNFKTNFEDPIQLTVL